MMFFINNPKGQMLCDVAVPIRRPIQSCREQDGVNRFHICSPEGLIIRISEKELIQIVST
jgi:hypothetical protein